MKTVIMIARIEAREDFLASIHGGIKREVTIHIRVNKDARWLRDDDLVVKHAHAERRDERLFLNKTMRLVRLAIAIGVFEHHDAIALGAPRDVLAIVHPFRHPDATRGIGVDVGGIEKHRRRGPKSDLKVVGHLEMIGRNTCGR